MKRASLLTLTLIGAFSAIQAAWAVIVVMFVGIVGVAFGVASGLLVAENVGAIVSTIEGIFNVEFLPKSIYFISDMPSDPRMSDIIPIALFSFLLSLAATLYPSWRAAKLDPVEALRYG